MAGYLGAIPVPQATQHRESFTATSGQTTFATAGYTVGFLDVYLNGSHLSPADFTATNGSDVVLASGASADDVCDIISYTAFEVADQTFTGTTTMDVAAITGVLTTTAATVFNGGFASNADSTMGTDKKLIFRDAAIHISSTADGDMSIAADDEIDITSTLIDINGAVDMSSTLATASTITVTTSASTKAGSFVGNGIEIKHPTGASNLFIGTQTGNDVKIAAIGAQAMRLDTNGTERMRLDSSGNVGIGTSSINSFSGYTTLEINNATNGAILDLSQGDTMRGRLVGTTSALAVETSGSIPIVFQPGGTERMRIDSSGNVLVGGTSTDPIANNTNSTQIAADGYININRANNTSFYIGRSGSDGQAILFYKGTANVGSISLTGSNTAFNTSSDYRLKTDAQPMAGASARVQALKPVNFEWISDGTRVDGFLAHEAQAVVPEAVTGTKDAMRDEEYQVSAATGDIYTPVTDEADEVIHSADVEQPETLEDGQQWRETKPAVMGTRSVPDMQGIDQSKMVPLLVAALQEALARITALENA